MAEVFVPRRVRQRIALGISNEEMASELQVTTEQLVVIEAHDGLPRADAIGRAWDLALGRIVKACEDAVNDEAAVASEGPPDTSDALRQWGTGPERAHSMPTEAPAPDAKVAKRSDMSKKAKRTSRRKRGSK